MLGFERLKCLYASGEDFGELYGTCLNTPNMIFLFKKGTCLKVLDYASPSVKQESCLSRRCIVGLWPDIMVKTRALLLAGDDKRRLIS